MARVWYFVGLGCYALDFVWLFICFGVLFGWIGVGLMLGAVGIAVGFDFVDEFYWFVGG